MSLWVALTAALCAAAHAEDTRVEIALKQSALVSRDVIRLADVARLGEGAPEEASKLSLGNAPWPGSGREISRALIKVRLASAGLDLSRFAFTGGEVCLVELDTIRIEPDEIVAAARRCLASFFADGGPEVRIELLREVLPVLVSAAGGRPELRAAVAGGGVPTGNVRVDVSIVRGGVRLKRVPVGFAVRLYKRVAVAAETIPSGDRFKTKSLTFALRDMTSVRGGCFYSPERLIGKVASRTVKPGEIITRRMAGEAEAPLVIEANQRVFLVVRTRTLRVITLGRALARARKGEIARAKNLTTGREVVGVAVDDSTIQVFLGGASDAEYGHAGL